MIQITIKTENKKDTYGKRLCSCVDIYADPFANAEKVVSEIRQIMQERENYTEEYVIQVLKSEMAGNVNINHAISSAGITFAMIGIVLSGLMGAVFLPVWIRWIALIISVAVVWLLYRISRHHAHSCYAEKFVWNILENWEQFKGRYERKES